MNKNRPSLQAQTQVDYSTLMRHPRQHLPGPCASVAELRETIRFRDKTKTHDTEWEAGNLLLGLYTVVGVLGRGGMGTVYRIRHNAWGVDLTVKSPHPDLLVDNDARASFLREAEMWVRLGLHPNVVTCHYVRAIDGFPRIFAEYVDGCSLNDWIRLAHEASLETRLDIAIQFAWGLHFAHTRGLCHGDVKPHNVIIGPETTAKVTDFGLAHSLRKVPGVAESGILSGLTPAYGSPEQFDKEPVGVPSDVWSWGLSVLELFLGESRWESGLAAPMVLEELRRNNPDPQFLTEDLLDVFEKCFCFRPADRWGSMLEIIARLKAIHLKTCGRAYPRQLAANTRLRSDALNNRALSFIDLARHDEALRCLDDALLIDPHHIAATFNRGLLLWRAGRISAGELVRQMEEVRETHTADWRDDYLLGLIHLEQENDDRARSALELALLQSDGDARVKAALQRLDTNDPALPRTCEFFLSRVLSADEAVTHRKRLHELVGRVAILLRRRRVDDAYEALQEARAIPGYTRDPRVQAVAGLFHQYGSPRRLLHAYCLSHVTAHEGRILDMTFVRKNARFAVVSSDGAVRVWSVRDGRFVCMLNPDDAPCSFAKFPPGVPVPCIANAAGISPPIIDAGESAPAWPCPDSVTPADLTVGDGWLGLLDTVGGVWIHRFSGEDGWLRLCHDAPVSAIGGGMHPTDLIIGTADGNLGAWTPEGELVFLDTGTASPIQCVAQSRDGARAAFVFDDHAIGGWNVADRQLCGWTLRHTGAVNCLAWVPGNRFILSGSANANVRLWDTETGETVRKFHGHDAAVTSLCVSTDASLFLSGDAAGNIRSWSLDWDWALTGD